MLFAPIVARLIILNLINCIEIVQQKVSFVVDNALMSLKKLGFVVKTTINLVCLLKLIALKKRKEILTDLEVAELNKKL